MTPDFDGIGKRTEEEFIEMFSYGKVFMLRNPSSNGRQANAHRMYLQRGTNPLRYRTQPKGEPHAVQIPGVRVIEGDILFFGTDGSPSLLRPGGDECFLEEIATYGV